MAIQVAVVGCGNFARAIHLPNILKLPEYQLRLVVDADVPRARDTAEQFQVPDHSCSYDDALSNAEIDLVIICTPHNQHAQMAIQAVNAGKHVLVEKPMAMKLEELKPVVDEVRRQGVTFTVGFNRRYSELSKKAKHLLDGRKYPLLINYRMVNNIVSHPWALDPEIGGGRIISEVVHLFDYCAFMVGEEPVRIWAEGGNLTHPDIPGTIDNAAITLNFRGGSIVNILVGDLGSDRYPKERVELFSDERTIVIDDYVSLETRGFEEDLNITLPTVDKGFVQELVELAEAIRSRSPAPVTETDGARATLCAVGAMEAIRTGQVQMLDLSPYVGGK